MERRTSSPARPATRAERAATKVLGDARQEFELLEEPWNNYVIDVELIATLLFSLGVQRVEDLRIGQRVYAGLLDGRAKLIAVEGLDGAPRQRFSLAHELGHYVLHFLPQPDGRGLFTCTSQDMAVGNLRGHGDFSAAGGPPPFQQAQADLVYARQEMEANQFAAALLMPEPAVRAMHQVVGGRLFALARHFQVSQQAMEIRLGRLGLVAR